MRDLKTVYEGSNIQGSAHVSCIKYRNLQNISHYHSDYELVYVNEGIAQVAVNDKKYSVRQKPKPRNRHAENALRRLGHNHS